MALVNGTLPFMQLTEAGLPPSCAGGGARLTLMLMMMMMIETMMMKIMIMMMMMIMMMVIMMIMATDHGEPEWHFIISNDNKQTNQYLVFPHENSCANKLDPPPEAGFFAEQTCIARGARVGVRLTCLRRGTPKTAWSRGASP